MMSKKRKTVIVILLTIFVFGYGSLGYMVIEGWSFTDAFYMTVITISTVGFSEINEISGVGRIFTITLIFFGVGLFLSLAASVMQATVEGRLRKILGRARLDNKLAKVKDHTIVCGYGRIGRSLCKVLLEKDKDVVAIEMNRDRQRLMHDDGVLWVVGPATDEANLIRAGIKRANGLVTAVGLDTDNVFLVLTAKQLNPGINVVSRANQRENIKTLYAAGANKVISLFEIGGRRMANAILRPTVMNFLDQAISDSQTDFYIEEIEVSDGSDLAGISLRDSPFRDRLNLLIIAIMKVDGSMLFNPSADTCLNVNDVVIAVGRGQHLVELESLLGP
jgi:voltage-gated potassium channel